MTQLDDQLVTDRQIEIIDARARALIERHEISVVKGVVIDDGDPATHTFSAYLDGSSDASPGILYGLDRPLTGDVCLVGKGPLTSVRFLISIVSRERGDAVSTGSSGDLLNIDGGSPASVYGGVPVIDGGAP